MVELASAVDHERRAALLRGRHRLIAPSRARPPPPGPPPWRPPCAQSMARGAPPGGGTRGRDAGDVGLAGVAGHVAQLSLVEPGEPREAAASGPWPGYCACRMPQPPPRRDFAQSSIQERSLHKLSFFQICPRTRASFAPGWASIGPNSGKLGPLSPEFVALDVSGVYLSIGCRSRRWALRARTWTIFGISTDFGREADVRGAVVAGWDLRRNKRVASRGLPRVRCTQLVG